MLKNANDIELWSEEVRQILRKPPPSLVRWGTTVIVLALAVAVGVSFFIKYPSGIQSTIVLMEHHAGQVKLEQSSVRRVRPAQAVKIRLDLYPAVIFKGSVESINPHINQDGAITVMVRLIDVVDDTQLSSGMTGTAEIITDNTSIAGKLFR